MELTDQLLASRLLAGSLVDPDELTACQQIQHEAEQTGQHQPLAQILLRRRILPAWQLGQLLLELQTQDEGTLCQESHSKTPATDSSRKSPGVLGRYPVTGLLGSGGMGQVLDVHDQQVGRQIAAKVIRGSASPRTRA